MGNFTELHLVCKLWDHNKGAVIQIKRSPLSYRKIHSINFRVRRELDGKSGFRDWQDLLYNAKSDRVGDLSMLKKPTH
jgi:hypothetical protein